MNGADASFASALVFRNDESAALSPVGEIEPKDETDDDENEHDVVVFFPISIRLGTVALGMCGIIADGKCVALLNFYGRHKTCVVRLAADLVGDFNGVVGWLSAYVFFLRIAIEFADLDFGDGFRPVAVAKFAEQLGEHGKILCQAGRITKEFVWKGANRGRRALRSKNRGCRRRAASVLSSVLLLAERGHWDGDVIGCGANSDSTLAGVRRGGADALR